MVLTWNIIRVVLIIIVLVNEVAALLTVFRKKEILRQPGHGSLF